MLLTRNKINGIVIPHALERVRSFVIDQIKDPSTSARNSEQYKKGARAVINWVELGYAYKLLDPIEEKDLVEFFAGQVNQADKVIEKNQKEGNWDSAFFNFVVKEFWMGMWQAATYLIRDEEYKLAVKVSSCNAK